MKIADFDRLPHKLAAKMDANAQVRFPKSIVPSSDCWVIWFLLAIFVCKVFSVQITPTTPLGSEMASAQQPVSASRCRWRRSRWSRRHSEAQIRSVPKKDFGLANSKWQAFLDAEELCNAAMRRYPLAAAMVWRVADGGMDYCYRYVVSVKQCFIILKLRLSPWWRLIFFYCSHSQIVNVETRRRPPYPRWSDGYCTARSFLSISPPLPQDWCTATTASDASAPPPRGVQLVTSAQALPNFRAVAG